MYTVYIIFVIVLILSFITGSIILLVEHKPSIKRKEIPKTFIFDEEII